jgi:pimeloyl-ACP methyl ester carboxylesterase
VLRVLACGRIDEPKDLTVRTPSLLIWGDRDAYLTTRTAEWTRHHIADLEIAYIRGASHWVQQDSPDIVNRYALDFLQSG